MSYHTINTVAYSDFRKSLKADDLGLFPNSSTLVTKLTITPEPNSYIQNPRKVAALQVTNGDFRFTVVLDRGMEIYEAHYGEDSLGWQTPIGGLYHPADLEAHLYRTGRNLAGETPTDVAPGIAGPLMGFANMVWKCNPNFGGPKNANEGYDLLHGRATYAITDRTTVRVSTLTDGRDFYLGIEGKTTVAGHTNTTSILTKIGGSSFIYSETAVGQFAFHNQLMPGEIVLATRIVCPRDQKYRHSHIEGWHHYGRPSTRPGEEVFYNVLAPVPGLEKLVLLDGKRLTAAMSVQGARRDKAVYCAFSLDELPAFTHWKVNGRWFIDHTREVRVFGAEPSSGSYPHEKDPAMGSTTAPRTFREEIGFISGLPNVTAMAKRLHKAVKFEHPVVVFGRKRGRFKDQFRLNK